MTNIRIVSVVATVLLSVTVPSILSLQPKSHEAQEHVQLNSETLASIIVAETAQEAPQSTQNVETSNTPSEPTIEPVQAPAVVEEPVQAPVEPPAPSGTCRDAIAREWPAELQSGAIVVMTHENGREDPTAVGRINPDTVGSQDFGCFQINNHWHYKFFEANDWRDPYANARYAYQIYRERQAVNGNGWTAWYAVRGILW